MGDAVDDIMVNKVIDHLADVEMQKAAREKKKQEDMQKIFDAMKHKQSSSDYGKKYLV